MVRLFHYDRLDAFNTENYKICQNTNKAIGKSNQQRVENHYNYLYGDFVDAQNPKTTTLAVDLKYVRKSLPKKCLKWWKGFLLESRFQTMSSTCGCDLLATKTSKTKCLDFKDRIHYNVIEEDEEKTVKKQIPAQKNFTKPTNKEKCSITLNCWRKAKRKIANPTTAELDAGNFDRLPLLLNKVTSSNRTEEGHHDQTHGSEMEALLGSNWFQPQISRKKADSQLQLSSPGDFLVRRNASTAQLELCLRCDKNKIKHYSIIYTNDKNEQQKYYKLKGAKKHFKTLRAVIVHHSVMPEHLPLTLNLPAEFLTTKNRS